MDIFNSAECIYILKNTNGESDVVLEKLDCESYYEKAIIIKEPGLDEETVNKNIKLLAAFGMTDLYNDEGSVKDNLFAIFGEDIGIDKKQDEPPKELIKVYTMKRDYSEIGFYETMELKDLPKDEFIFIVNDVVWFHNVPNNMFKTIFEEVNPQIVDVFDIVYSFDGYYNKKKIEPSPYGLVAALNKIGIEAVAV